MKRLLLIAAIALCLVTVPLRSQAGIIATTILGPAWGYWQAQR